MRNRQFHGLKFLRQHVIAYPFDAAFTKFYIADFYCDQLKVIVELDGQIHKELVEYDLIRTKHMESRGFYVLRFTNDQILHDWTRVCETLEHLLSGSLH